MYEKPRLRINPKTGRPYNVYPNGPGFRFVIRVNGKRYRTITYSDMYTPAATAHLDERNLHS